MAQNVVEKIVQRFAVPAVPGEELHSGDFVTVKPLHVMTHDNSGAVIKKFQSLGAQRVADAAQPVFCLDHDVQNTSAENLEKYRGIEAFAAEHGIAFHPAGRGIGHQIMAEEGFARPGALVVGSDSHSNLYGALGALGTPVVRTDAAASKVTRATLPSSPSCSGTNFRVTVRSSPAGMVPSCQSNRSPCISGVGDASSNRMPAGTAS